MKLKNKNILVTGAGGFIGSHLVERLLEKGADVTCLIYYNPNNSWLNLEHLDEKKKEKIKAVLGDIRDLHFMNGLVKDKDVVFHLAALISIPYSYVSPAMYVDTNIRGTLNVMEACLNNKIKKVIHTSTSETYGTAKYVPIDEEHPLQGQSPYSASKIGADKLVESFYLSFGLPVATLRPFNTFGPRQSSRAIIPTIITQALVKKKIKLGSLHPTRDLTYIKDIAEAFIKVAENDKSIGRVINAGSNFEISIEDLVQKICGLIGKDIKIECDKKRIRPKKSEVDRLLADNSLAKNLIGWEPRYSLDSGLKETIDWIKNNLNKFNINQYNI